MDIDKAKKCITCTETMIIPFKFPITDVMYIFVNQQFGWIGAMITLR